MLVRKAYKFRIEPTRAQRQLIEETAGVVRFIWDSALDLQKQRLQRRARLLTYADLCKELTAARNDPELEFLARVHSKPQQQVLKDLRRAFRDFFGGLRGFPRFKKKGRHDAFRHPERVRVVGRHVQIPGLGAVRFRKSRDVEGVIKNATLSKRGGHWYVAIQTEEEIGSPTHPSESEVGIDLGVRRFAVLSSGEVIMPARHFRRLEAKLAREQRKLSRKQKYSKNWKKQKARIARLHVRIADARRDFQHKVSTAISKSHALVCVEDLKVAKMSASARGTVEAPGKKVRAKAGLNKSILDQGWYEFRRQLQYKQLWRGGRMIAVAPAGTSQRCSRCGHRSPANRRSQSVFVCVACGHRADADVNAAKNILAAGRAATACGEGSPSLKQEPLAA